MQSSAQESYLVTEVMTATPQKLQLMLIETALRSAERAKLKWQAQEDEQACELLIHAQQIMSEMLSALDHEVSPDLTRRVAAIYLFVFRSLMEANMQHDKEKLDAAIRILAIERETWHKVCEDLGSRQSEGWTPSKQPVAAAAAHGGGPGFGVTEDLPAGGLSLEG